MADYKNRCFIAEAWSLWANALPPDIDPELRATFRTYFFCGASAVFTNAAYTPKNKDEAFEILSSIQSEIDVFMKQNEAEIIGYQEGRV